MQSASIALSDFLSLQCSTEITGRGQPLWAITSYFNPIGYGRRKQNFHRFREALSVPLIAVELSNSGEFELQPGDADILVRTKSDSVLWQKERLFNVALGHVPADVQYIAWLDCDVIFEDPDWHEAALSLLRQSALVQLFSSLHDLDRDDPRDIRQLNTEPPTGHSVAKLLATGSWTKHDLYPTTTRQMRTASFGLAWAARRQLLHKHGFYDAMIMGSGDRAMACAAYGRMDAARSTIRLNPQRAKHYESWATAFHADVASNVGYIDGRLFHLWHGDIADRRYAERHVDFSGISFDPESDLRINDSGAFEWASGRSDLHKFAVEYFRARCEDGH
jgi:hypothetical protein